MILRDCFRKETLCTGLACTVFLLMLTIPATADPTTATQAEAVVKGWLGTGMTPLGTSMPREIGEVKTYRDDETIIYYVVCLDPEGFVIVPADDEIEPIVGFFPEGDYDPSNNNPLGVLVGQDMEARVTEVRTVMAQAPSGSAAQEKWDTLESIGSGTYKPSHKLELADDEIWVGPLVESTWDQGTVWDAASEQYSAIACYNYYTPSNYVSGCVATAMAQVMRYHEYPSTGVDSAVQYPIEVDDGLQLRTLRGGDGNGGPYTWDNMPLEPDVTITETQQQAIGAICHDAGVAVEMSYSPTLSAAYMLIASQALVDTFLYGNSIVGEKFDEELGWMSIGAGLVDMINPNLDAANPILLGLNSPVTGAHAIVCDGYGYNLETLYHHLNLGWSGRSDGWYELPTSDLGPVTDCVYNVFTTGTGEIVSGRVIDSSGNPISGATVTAADEDEQEYEATTNDKGIYALTIPSDTSFILSASAQGSTFSQKPVTTGTSTDSEDVSGNKWGIDFEHDSTPEIMPVGPPTVSQFQVGSGDGYIDTEWIYPEPIDNYDGILIAYGLNVFPTLKAGDEKPVIVNGLLVYDGTEETAAKVVLVNGTTAFFAVWTYSGTEFSNPNYAVGTPAPGADGINEFESLTSVNSSGGSDSCFITTAAGGRTAFLRGILGKADQPADVHQTNSKKLHDARVKFLEQFRKAKKPQEGPGRIVGFVVKESDRSAIEGAALKATLIKKKPIPKKDKKTKLRATIGTPTSEKGTDKKAVEKPKKEEKTIVDATSGSNGAYEIEGLPPGRYKLEVTAEGFRKYERKSVFVNSGIGPGLGNWMVIMLKDIAERKGGIVGEITFVESTHKHIKVQVKESSKDWEALIGTEILLLSGTNSTVLKVVTTLSAGTAVECHFVERGDRYHLLSIEVEEEDE